MLELVTKDEAKAQLRVTDEGSGGGAYDAWLDLWIPIISDAVAAWLKDSWRLYIPELDAEGNPIEDSSGYFIPAVDSSGNPTVHPAVKGAVLVELTSQDRFRDGVGVSQVPSEAGYGYVLGWAATNLLVSLRKSTVA